MHLDRMDLDGLPEMSRSPTPPSTLSAQSIADEDEEMEKIEGLPLSVFDRVTAELLKLGAIPLERFASEDNPSEMPQQNILAPLTSQLDKELDDSGMMVDGSGNGKATRKEHFQAVAKIYEACKKTFENSEAIDFHYKEDAGSTSIECILTLTRPDGRKRSYTSGPHYSKRSDAKAQAASVAVSMGALEFIKYGDIDPKARSTAIVDSLDTPGRLKVGDDGKGVSFSDQTETMVNDANVKAISDCCLEWRAGLVKPVYVHFSEPTIVPRVHGKKAKTVGPPTEEELLALKQGCALKIEISQHTSRVFSVHHTYKTRADAKAAVAAIAIKQGVLDFIKFANGQTSPLKVIGELERDAEENLNREIINMTSKPAKEVTIEATAVNVTLKKHQIPLNAMTLHAFTNSLPKPFPETPGLKPVGEGNPVGWLNAAAQSARGSKMSLSWTYLSNAKLSLHGCLVRFNLPKIEGGRSYLVEPQFTKRSDAKSAVALLAISQNVGGWIHDITVAIENLITPDMKVKAASLIGPLYQECTRARILGQPTYTYVHEDGAVGCTLRVEFDPHLWREYRVPVQYRTKPDARFAVVLQAHLEGVLEFIRFRGGDPPTGYNPELPYDWKMVKKVEKAQERDKDLQAPTKTEAIEDGRGSLGRVGTMPRPDIAAKSFGRDRANNKSHDLGLGYPPRRYSENGPRFEQHGEHAPRAHHYHRNSTGSNAGGVAGSNSGPRQDLGILRGSRSSQSINARSNSFPGREHDGFGTHGSEYVHSGRPAGPLPQGNYNPHSQFTLPVPPPPMGYHYPYEQYPPPPPAPLPYAGPPADLYASRPGYTPIPPPPPPAQDYYSYPNGPRAYRDDSYGYQHHDYGYDYDYGQYPGRSRDDGSDRYGMEDASEFSFESRDAGSYPRGSVHANGRYDETSTSSGGEKGRPPRPNQRFDARGPATGWGRNQKHDKLTPAGNGWTSNLVARNTAEADRPQIERAQLGTKPPTSTTTPTDFGQASSRKRAREASPPIPTRPPRVDAQPGRNEAALIEHCSRNGMKQPIFRHEEIKTGEFKVSVVLDKERFSLPQTFRSVNAGKDEVSGKVLNRLKDAAKRRRVEEG